MKELKAGFKFFIALWVLSDDALSLLLTGYTMDVPVAKYFFTVFESIDGWGIETVFVALGLGAVFYLVRDRQKNPWVSGISIFFAICTTFGISYAKTDSWNCIFLFWMQFVLAVFVTLGYYFLYKNSLLFIGYVIERKSELLKRPPSTKIELFLFDKHTFLGPFMFVVIFSLPWLIAFFPGTLALLIAFVYLIRRNRRAIAALIPGICVVLICMASPVNGYLRYMLPVMVTMPVILAWCYIVREQGKGAYDEQQRAADHS